MFYTWVRTMVARKLALVQDPLGILQVVPLHRVELAVGLQQNHVYQEVRVGSKPPA